MSNKALDQRRKALVKANEAKILQKQVRNYKLTNGLQQSYVRPK